MENTDLETIELTAADAARALNVSYTTMVTWLEGKQIAGRQTLTNRRYTTVGALRAFLATRGEQGEAALPGLEEYVIHYVLPKQAEKGGSIISTDVLALHSYTQYTKAAAGSPTETQP